ncbi:hypothetical protein FP803_03625 [Candidatus Woesearchaeota archaeon]|nr:hypothetical protein [Candidatus Woesearchaeota archaeon]
MKKEIFFGGIVLLLLLASGCNLTETKYVCPDGSVVTNLDECPGTEEAEEELITEILEEVEPEVVELTKIIVKEGELVVLKPESEDPDADTILYTFSEPLDKNGRWQTKKGDAGSYEMTVTASDSELTDTQKILLVVESTNNPPVLSPIADITINEGETVSLEPIATDPDGDKVIITYSGWMTEASYTTNYNDAGTHIVTVTASDGIESASQDVIVTVNNINRPPRIVKIVKG